MQPLPLPLPPSGLLQALVVEDAAEAVVEEEAALNEAAERAKAMRTASEWEVVTHREEWEAQASDPSSQRADAIRRLSQLTSYAYVKPGER